MTTSRQPALIALPARALRLSAGLAALGLVAACAGPPRPAPPAQTIQPVTVVVERGDTLSGLARQHGVALQALASANGLAPPYRIHPGQVLHLPGTPPPPPATASQLAPAAPIQPPAPPVEAATVPSPPARTVTAEPLPPPGAPPPSPQAALPAPPAPPPPAAAPAAAPAPSERAAAEPAARASPAPPQRRLPPGRFAWPVRGQVVSGFGAKGGGLVNDGMNIAAPRGTPVRAAADGTVIYAGNEVRGFGNLVLIRHEGGWVTAYGHADRLLVRQGQAVRAGEEIARVGSSGAVTTPQLHFQVRRDGKPVDPAAHLERAVANRAS
jgi:murein DD-endopeptidase MepM/ murein hydrolase activator NlpD